MILMLRSLFCILLLLSVAGSAAAADRNGDDDAQLDSATLDLIHEGVALRRAGKDEAALNVFLEAEKHAPNSVRVLLHVTAAGQATGKWLLAFQYLQKASTHSDDPYYQRYRPRFAAWKRRWLSTWVSFASRVPHPARKCM